MDGYALWMLPRSVLPGGVDMVGISQWEAPGGAGASPFSLYFGLLKLQQGVTPWNSFGKRVRQSLEPLSQSNEGAREREVQQ